MRGALLAAACVIGHVACARRPAAPAPVPAAPDARPAAAEGKFDLWEYAERMEKLRAENARLRKELNEKTRTIAWLNDAGVPVADLVAGAGEQPEIHAKVLAVRPEVNLVMLSVGTDEKVRKGLRFSIYRGERYIGKVEVEKMFANMCSARIIREWTKERIKEGDDATTSAVAGDPRKEGGEVF